MFHLKLERFKMNSFSESSGDGSPFSVSSSSNSSSFPGSSSSSSSSYTSSSSSSSSSGFKANI